jgi:hypothetical protein
VLFRFRRGAYHLGPTSSVIYNLKFITHTLDVRFRLSLSGGIYEIPKIGGRLVAGVLEDASLHIVLPVEEGVGAVVDIDVESWWRAASNANRSASIE